MKYWNFEYFKINLQNRNFTLEKKNWLKVTDLFISLTFIFASIEVNYSRRISNIKVYFRLCFTLLSNDCWHSYWIWVEKVNAILKISYFYSSLICQNLYINGEFRWILIKIIIKGNLNIRLFLFYSKDSKTKIDKNR